MEKNKTTADFRNLLNNQNEEEVKKCDAVVLTARFIDAIQGLMTRKGINQKELAPMVGCTPSYLSQVFSWDKPLNMVLFSQILKKLDAEIVFEIKEKEQVSTITDASPSDIATSYRNQDSLSCMPSFKSTPRFIVTSGEAIHSGFNRQSTSDNPMYYDKPSLVA